MAITIYLIGVVMAITMDILIVKSFVDDFETKDFYVRSLYYLCSWFAVVALILAYFIIKSDEKHDRTSKQHTRKEV